MRYAAPADVSGIILTSGPLTVVDGFVEAPEDATPGDLGGLAMYGFTPAPIELETPAKATKAIEPTPAPEPTE